MTVLNPDQFRFVPSTHKEMGGFPHHALLYRGEGPETAGPPMGFHTDSPNDAYLEWHHKTGEIMGIGVPEHMRRQGIATGLYSQAKQIASTTRGVPNPKHSRDRSESGEAWARSLGERLPRRIGAKE